jgi:transposase-like protein
MPEPSLSCPSCRAQDIDIEILVAVADRRPYRCRRCHTAFNLIPPGSNSGRPTIVLLPCPACRQSHTWVTMRSPTTATLNCPHCNHAWDEDVQNHPVLRALPLTLPSGLF